jgi:ferredoxin
VNVKPAAVEVKKMIEEEPATVEATEPDKPATAEVPASDKATFTVTMNTPDGTLSAEYDPKDGYYLLDYLDELENADEYAELPYACRAGSCSACAAKIVSGTMDVKDCGFLSDDQKADGWVLTCTAKPTSDVVLQMHMEDEMY